VIRDVKIHLGQTWHVMFCCFPGPGCSYLVFLAALLDVQSAA